MKKFVDRHGEALCLKNGKVTSPTRSSDTMLQQTEESIAEFDQLFREKRINKKNLLVFDETIIGESDLQQLFIGERRKSGGGNINVFKKRAKALGAYIPFSTCEGDTPFKVFCRRVGKAAKRAGSQHQTVTSEQVIRTATEYRLIVSSECGYMTLPLFECIMNHFIKWWNEENPGLDCFLLCDNLRIHVNKNVCDMAESKGVHIKTIMPGSSHWFQVHDQLPFGMLKKKCLS